MKCGTLNSIKIYKQHNKKDYEGSRKDSLHPSWDYSVPSFRESTVRTIPVSCIIFDEINHTKGILWERIIQRI